MTITTPNGQIEINCSLRHIFADDWGYLQYDDCDYFDVSTESVTNQQATLNELETSREYTQHRRFHKSGLCPLCPPRGGENARRQPAHPAKKPRYKDQRRTA